MRKCKDEEELSKLGNASETAFRQFRCASLLPNRSTLSRNILQFVNTVFTTTKTIFTTIDIIVPTANTIIKTTTEVVLTTTQTILTATETGTLLPPSARMFDLLTLP
jgi:hypothetical protein